MPSHYDIKLPKITSHETIPWHEMEAQWEAMGPLGTEQLHCPGLTVTYKSPANHRKAIEQIARYFRREFHYDFVQYLANEEDTKAISYGWLSSGYLGESNTVTGGCSFRWREWSDAPAGWSLSWIWMHPYCRNNGLLSKNWPCFVARFGEFHVETPYSPAMAAFLNKRGLLKGSQNG